MSSYTVSSDASRSLEIRALSLHPPTQETDSTRLNALATLRPYLPVSLPIYRRLQFGRFFDATTVLTNLDLSSHVQPPEAGTTEPWLIAFIDRSCRPETEVWLYGSWESQSTDRSPDSKEQTLVQNLLRAMKALPIPDSIHQDILNAKAAEANSIDNNDDNDKDSVGLSKSDYAAHMLDPNIMLWGSIHERTLPILQRLGVAGGEKFKAAAMPNLMFTWDVDALGPTREDLPGGLHWGPLSRSHFAKVRARTQIPRQDRTLAELPSLGIYPGAPPFAKIRPHPIAWVFVGLDGSLTTLHVEPEWRGKGLAKAMTAKLFREKMGLFWEEGLTKWAHGYVIRGNKESEGMCRSLGGKAEWDVYWVRVDLDAV